MADSFIVKQIMERSLSINNYTEIINSLYNEVWNKYNSIQDAYDRETAHGTIKDEQDRWINKVANELDGLKDYE